MQKQAFDLLQNFEKYHSQNGADSGAKTRREKRHGSGYNNWCEHGHTKLIHLLFWTKHGDEHWDTHVYNKQYFQKIDIYIYIYIFRRAPDFQRFHSIRYARWMFLLPSCLLPPCAHPRSCSLLPPSLVLPPSSLLLLHLLLDLQVLMSLPTSFITLFPTSSPTSFTTTCPTSSTTSFHTFFLTFLTSPPLLPPLPPPPRPPPYQDSCCMTLGIRATCIYIYIYIYIHILKIGLAVNGCIETDSIAEILQ